MTHPRARKSLLLAALASGALAGPAGAQQSLNVTLLANVDLTESYMDVWGFEKDGIQLAILCDVAGTSFINITDPANALPIFYMPGTPGIWRDAKTYGDYCYIVAEQTGAIEVVDLSFPLQPTPLPLAGATEFQTAHNAWVDEEAGLLFVVGCDYLTLGRTDTHIYDLKPNPAIPQYIYTFDEHYVHDMYSRDGIAYLASIYAGVLSVADISQLPNAMPILDQIQTDGAFTHNTWLTGDGRTCITTDEQNTGHLTFIDVSNPNDLRYLSSYRNPSDPGSVVHNVTVKNDIAYASWYKAGLEVVDVGDPRNPRRIGFYDTFPGSGGGFDGAWGVYPFNSAGKILISDMESGLYVLDLDENAFGFAEGVVTSLTSGQPIAGASVTLDLISARLGGQARGQTTVTTTNDVGFYHVLVAPGEYDLLFEAPPFESLSIQATVPPGGTVVVDAQLDPGEVGRIAGTVRDVNTSSPISEAVVTFEDLSIETITDESGAYAFEDIQVGNGYTLSAVSTRYCPGSPLVVNVLEGRTSVADFLLLAAPLADDFEVDAGWTAGAAGDDAASGIWTRVDPNGTAAQPEDDHTPDPGTDCWVTGQAIAGGAIGLNDVDGGQTTLLSPIVDLSAVQEPVVTYYRWFYTNEVGMSDDRLWALYSTDAGQNWSTFETINVSDPKWTRREHTFPPELTLTTVMRFAFVAADLGAGSIVEAGIDDFQICSATALAIEPGSLAPPRPVLAARPNPFRSSVTISVSLPGAADPRVNVYDVAGRLVRRLADARFADGLTSFTWDGRDGSGRVLSPGVYLYRLESAEHVATRKVVLSR